MCVDSDWIDDRVPLCRSSDEYWKDAEQLRAAHLTEAGVIGPHDFLAARRAMEAELEAVKRLPFLLRSRINTLSLVGQLSEEVLIQIFLILHCIAPPGHHQYLRLGRRSIQRRIGWIKITHVCRRWRNAALAYPRLWNTNICSLGPKWMVKMLHRSGTTPVFVRLTEFMVLPDEITDTSFALSQHLKHVQELEVSVRNGKWNVIAPSLLGEALLLEKCVLSGFACIWDDVGLTLGLFGQHTPHLRQLDMNEMPVFWSSLRSSCLTFLKVTDQPNRRARVDNSSFTDFLDAIERMPALETLILWHSMPALPHTSTLHSDDYSRTIINLPRLQELELTDDILACALLLQCTTVPGTATQIIYCFYDDFVQRPINLIFPWVKSRVNTSLPIRKLSVSDQYYPENSIHILAFDEYDKEDDSHFEQLQDSPIFGLTISHTPSMLMERLPLPELKAWSLIQAMRTASVLPLEDLEVLLITGGHWLQRVHWLDTFGDLDRVSVVHASGHCAEHFCYAFCKSDPSDYSSQEFRDTKTGILFPSLDTLIIKDVLLGFDDDIGRFAKTLTMYLEQRSRLPVRPLRRLKIGGDCGCEVSQTYRRVKKIMPTVEWSSCEGSTEEGKEFASEDESEDESEEENDAQEEEGDEPDDDDNDEDNDEDDGNDDEEGKGYDG
ncbi:hypothetical protein EVG20_g1604 [Dentipellis fragilis]|uniref:Uncharacterized protein n=1 Tax=Dentipellis fragilis TaxID=205917 RepID=A0A4Y9ZC67_9AGAM|nr:hypothetical protein EVG20_g1604 [Dentipellis fragilis]